MRSLSVVVEPVQGLSVTAPWTVLVCVWWEYMCVARTYSASQYVVAKGTTQY